MALVVAEYMLVAEALVEAVAEVVVVEIMAEDIMAEANIRYKLDA
jgi:hypothetical protein